MQPGSSGRRFELSTVVHGEDNPGTLNIRNNLGAVRLKQGRLDDAEEHMAVCLAGYLQLHGPDHPSTLLAANNLARVYSQLGDHDRALAMFDELLPRTRAALPAGHPYQILFRAGYGKVLAAAGRIDEGRRELGIAVESMRHTFGEDHPQTVANIKALAELEVGGGS